jgi:DNA-damage-inducible protein J
MQLHYIGHNEWSIVPMSANALIQTRIDADVKARASAVLETMGLTVSDAVRILLTRTAHEGALPFELMADRETYDAWFRAKVREALDDPRPDVSAEDVEAEFAARRAASLRKLGDA